MATRDEPPPRPTGPVDSAQRRPLVSRILPTFRTLPRTSPVSGGAPSRAVAWCRSTTSASAASVRRPYAVAWRVVIGIGGAGPSSSAPLRRSSRERDLLTADYPNGGSPGRCSSPTAHMPPSAAPLRCVDQGGNSPRARSSSSCAIGPGSPWPVSMSCVENSARCSYSLAVAATYPRCRLSSTRSCASTR